MNKSTYTEPVRLYWGENYASKPLTAIQAISATFQALQTDIHLYPGDWQEKTLNAISIAYNWPKNQILISNGIEGLLTHIFNTYVKNGDMIATLNPTFGAYEQNARIIGATCFSIPIKLDTQLSANSIIKQIPSNTTQIFLAMPNTMTGVYHISIFEIEKLAKAFSGLIIIDECYFGIGNVTVISLIHTYPNILVLRSASKSLGLAGLRIGWAMGTKDVINRLSKYSISVAPDPLPTISYATLSAILPFNIEICESFISFRNIFSSKLSQINGVTVHKTETTLIPITLPKQKMIAQTIHELENIGILLKNTSNLDYLLFGVPPKSKWDHVLSNFRKIIENQLKYL